MCIRDRPASGAAHRGVSRASADDQGPKGLGYLPPRVKAIVDAIVEELAKDERVSAAYETWQMIYEQVCLDYDQRPPKRLPLSQQKEFRSVRNMVIQETLQWMAERQRCADARRTPSAQESPIIKKDAAEAAPKNSEVTVSLASAQPKSDRAASATSEDSGSAEDVYKRQPWSCMTRCGSDRRNPARP